MRVIHRPLDHRQLGNPALSFQFRCQYSDTISASPMYDV